MPKTSLADWDETPVNNSEINSIGLAEGATPFANMNNAVREMMAQLKAGVGEQLLTTQTAAASATIDFVLTSYLSTYRAFKVVMTGVAPATDDVQFVMRTSTNAGSSYDSGASDYKWGSHALSDAGTATPLGDTADTSIRIAASVDNSATSSLSGEVWLYKPASTTLHTNVKSDVVFVANGGDLIRQSCMGQRATAADVDAIRFLMSSGNIASGTFALFGIR